LEEELIRGGSGGEGLAQVEGRGGDGDVADLHDPEPFLSYLVLFRFCAGSQKLSATSIGAKCLNLNAANFDVVDNCRERLRWYSGAGENLKT
jgi:hypothetical protein